MGRALALARLNHGRTGENPSVGCVIIDSDGHIAGLGVTGEGGRPHAEEGALLMAGERARGATAYVTLEPCGQRSSGSTPCWKRLAEAGIVRVVCALPDSHPLGRGGLLQLKAEGISVSVGTGKRRAYALYKSFLESVPASRATLSR